MYGVCISIVVFDIEVVVLFCSVIVGVEGRLVIVFWNRLGKGWIILLDKVVRLFVEFKCIVVWFVVCCCGILEVYCL